MKKQLLSFCCCIAFATTALAQTSKSFNKGDKLLNAGIGFGSPFFGTGYSNSLPFNPSVSFEVGATDEISVGGQVAYASSKFNYGYFGSTYSSKLNALYIGARGAYHFNDILEIDEKFDLYGGASLGYVIASVSDNDGYSGSAGSAVGFGAFAGGKYYFKPSTGVYAELGYQSLSFLNIGISFKF